VLTRDCPPPGEPDHDESIRIIHAALDAGINFLGTADVYSTGESEEIVGKALASGKRDDVVLASRRAEREQVQGPPSAARPPARFDMSDPANQRKLDAAEKLAQRAEQAGITLIELALAFALNHPAVTAAIIGPRTVGHLESQLTAAEIELTGNVLDRIEARAARASGAAPPA